MTKKIISLLLVLAMLLSLMGFAAADNAVSSTDPTDIYTYTAGAAQVPSKNGYIRTLTMSGVAVKSSSFTVNGSTVNVDVVLDDSVAAGSTWTLSVSGWACPPAPQFREYTTNSGAITWNSDNTADQVFTLTQTGT